MAAHGKRRPPVLGLRPGRRLRERTANKEAQNDVKGPGERRGSEKNPKAPKRLKKTKKSYTGTRGGLKGPKSPKETEKPKSSHRRGEVRDKSRNPQQDEKYQKYTHRTAGPDKTNKQSLDKRCKKAEKTKKQCPDRKG